MTFCCVKIIHSRRSIIILHPLKINIFRSLYYTPSASYAHCVHVDWVEGWHYRVTPKYICISLT